MGQKVGKAVVLDIAQPFSRLSKREILSLWQVFNHISEGFGIRLDELEEICSGLREVLGVSRQQLREHVGALFRCLDTKQSGTVDALELFSGLAVLSGMPKGAAVDFLLLIYDFDLQGSLCMDDAVLALKSAASGLCKLQAEMPGSTMAREQVLQPRDALLEQLVRDMFQGVDMLARPVLAALLCAHPDVGSWFAFFADPLEPARPSPYLLSPEGDLDFREENPKQNQTPAERLAVEWSVRCEEPEEPPTGEQWRAAVAQLQPVQYATEEVPRESPNCSVAPEWVYGYQSERSKGNVHYTLGGEVVYNVSKYAVLYSPKTHTQRIFSGHTHEILCVAMHPSKQVVATGEIGPEPSVLVWRADSLKILHCGRGFHRNGVTQLAFSPDGRILASVGNDAQQSISVCLWEEGTVLFNSPVSPSPCLSCAVLSGNTVVAAGDSFISFWSYYAEGYVQRSGNFSRFPLQPITALAPVSENLVAGTASGLLLLWVDVNCVKAVQAHKGCVCALHACTQGVLSGGADACIRMWSGTLEPSFCFDTRHCGLDPALRSVCLAPDGSSVVLGTRGADIHELAADDGSDLHGGPLVQGHAWGELSCTVTHPSLPHLLSAGQDGTLRLLDMDAHRQLRVQSFGGDLRAVAVNGVGDAVVLGFGGSAGSERAGVFLVLRGGDWATLHEGKDADTAITVAAFSHDGETLALGCAAGAIFLYATLDDYELVGKCDRHACPVTHIDMSVDGEWLRSNSSEGELFFFNTDDASFQSNVNAMRDVQWASHRCVYSWHVKEAHLSAFEAERLLCNESLPISEEEAGLVQPFLAAATSQGYLRLFPFPCAAEGAESHRVAAHCGEVSALRFSCNGERLVSSGRRDRCLVQWKCLPYPPDTDAAEEAESSVGGEGEEGEEKAKRVNLTKAKREAERALLNAALLDDRDLTLEARAGVELRQDFAPLHAQLSVGVINAVPLDIKFAPPLVPPGTPKTNWLTSVVEPYPTPQVKTALPQMSLLLEHVYGYEAQTMRNSVRYTGTGEVVYTVASLGLVADTGNKAQRIFKFHSDAISCIAVSRDGALVATGQLGHQPCVAVWAAHSCELLCSLPEAQLDGVACLAFSPDAELLAVVGMDREHTLSVYDWRTGVCLSKSYAGRRRVLGAFFTEDFEDQSSAGCGLVTYGMQNIKFWRGLNTRFPTSLRPRVKPLGVMQTMLCGEQFLGRPSLGTSDGSLYVFADNMLKKIIRAHQGPLTAMHVSSDERLVTGGRDGAVKIWGDGYACLREFLVPQLLDTVNASVRSVAFNQAGSRLVVGTRAAEIFEIDLQTGKVGDKGSSLVQGHGVRQLWGLASHPTREECVTSGDDCTIRIWDTRNYCMLRALKMNTPSRAVAYSPDGKLLVIGFGSGARSEGLPSDKEGAFTVMRTLDYKIMHEGKDAPLAIRAARFSPDMTTLALGSDDNNIYTYNVQTQYSRRSTISSHSAPVRFLDFSANSKHLASADAERFVRFSIALTGEAVGPETMKDEKWSCSSPFAWAAQGLWQSQAPGAEPVCAQKSWGGLLLAGGSSAGAVSVAHHPYPRRAGFLQVHAHAGPVAALAWVAGDGALLSVGGKDHALMQWRCAYEQGGVDGGKEAKEEEDSVVGIDGGHELVKTHMHPQRAGKRRALPPPSTKAGTGTATGAALVTDGSAMETKEDLGTIGTMGSIGSMGSMGSGNTMGDATEMEPEDPAAPWYQQISAPANTQEQFAPAPDAVLELDYAHGARLGDCRSLLRYNEDGSALYVVASVGVIFEQMQGRQRYYQGHRDAIISLDVDCTGKLAASGEQAELPELHVWCAKTGAAVTVFQRLHRQGVSSVSFSADGHSLVSLGQDAQCSVAVCYSPSGAWTDGLYVCSSSVSSSKMLWCLHSTCSVFPIVVGGAGGHVSFFRVVRGAAERLRGVFRRFKTQTMLCATEGSIAGTVGAKASAARGQAQAQGAQGDDASVDSGGGSVGSVGDSNAAPTSGAARRVLLCGSASGHVYVFHGECVAEAVQVANSPIYCLCVAGKGFLAACKDGQVVLLGSDLAPLHAFNAARYSPKPHLPSVHSVASNRQGTRFLVGMQGGEIFEVSAQTRAYSVLAQGHSRGELQALAVNPADPDEYATAGDDGVVMVWSLRRRYCLRKTSVGVPSRAIAWSPDGQRIIVGFGGGGASQAEGKDGAVVMLDALTLREVKEERRAKRAVTDLVYGPPLLKGGAEVLAMACADGKVYLLGAKLELVLVVEGANRGGVGVVDFSSDGGTMRYCTHTAMPPAEGQVGYYSLASLPPASITNPSAVRDVQWSNPRVPFSWHCKGAFRRISDLVPVTAVALHPGGHLLATSYRNGELRLFHYPCSREQSGFISLRGVASEAVRIAWSADGAFLLLVDAKTRAVLQFRLHAPTAPPASSEALVVASLD